MIDKQINLEIEKTNKEIINLKAHENDKISDILEQLQKSHRIPEKHSLVFKYKELSSERTLKSYLIGSEQRGNKLSLRVFGRRDELKKIEQRVQQKWDAQKTFEARPEDPEQPKFFATFPFPYVVFTLTFQNGLLHCGHGFSLSKAEFASGFQRLKGKNVLFPFGFHCTGMPIVASANKLKSELSLFGIPPDFPETNDAAAAKKSKDEPRNNTAKSKKKGKIASKKSRLLRQYQIMQELGVPEEQIPEFVDPRKWVDYFTPKCFDHLKRFGCKFDQRRCFVTTDLNPFFSRFVEWQFNRLKKSGFVRFGKRMCIFAPKDGQPCADHDRSSGEGVQPQEYTAIKLKALSSGNGRKFEKIERLASAGKSVFLVAGTLRPETMYGQTNCFVKPNGDYVAIETRNIVFDFFDRFGFFSR